MQQYILCTIDAIMETVAYESVARKKSPVPAEAPQFPQWARSETDRHTAHVEDHVSIQWFSMQEQIM